MSNPATVIAGPGSASPSVSAISFVAASGGLAATTIPYGPEFERKVASLLVGHRNFSREVSGIVDAEIIADNLLRVIVDNTVAYVRKYKDLPDPKVLFIDLVAKDKRVSKTELPAYASLISDLINNQPTDVAYVRDKLTEFVRNQKILKVVLSTPDLLKSGKFDDFRSQITSAMSTGEASAISEYEFFEEATARRERRDAIKAGIIKRGVSTGITELNDCLYHKGWVRGGLSIILAPTKRGKTAFMAQCALRACLNDKVNVLYITLEVDEELLSDRLEAALTSTRMDSLLSRADDIEKAVNAIPATARGKFYVERRPTNSLSAAGVESIVTAYVNKGHNIDLLVIDYMGIMKIASDSRYEQLGYYSKELRRIAGTYDVALLTALQTNRDGFSKSTAGAEHTADSFLPSQDCDLMISINADETELRAGIRRLRFALARMEAPMQIKIEGDMEMMQIFQRVLSVDPI
jgi:replicative DNA helicase